MRHRWIWFTFSLIFFSVATAGHTAPLSRTSDPVESLWVRLVETPAPPGQEQALADILRIALGDMPVYQDSLGNLWVTVGEGKPTWVVAAHMDEPAWVVGDIRTDGFLRVTPVAYTHMPARLSAMIMGSPVRVGPPWVNGVGVIPSIHLQRGVPRRRRHYNDLGMNRFYVDVGATDRNELTRAGVGFLSWVVPERWMHRLAGDRRAGWQVGDRALVEVLVHLARWLRARPPQDKRVVIAWLAQETYGAKGRQRMAQRLNVDRVVMLEVMGPFQKGGEWVWPDVQPGEGVLVGTGRPEYSQDLAHEILQVAHTFDIPAHAVPAGPMAPATYAPFRVPWPRADFVPVSIPVRYPSTLVETVSAKDRVHLLRLLGALLTGDPKVTLSASVPIAVPRDAPARTPGEALLRELVETYGISETEQAVAQVVRRHLPQWAQPQTDEMGNLWVTFGAQTGPHWVFVAHMDEIGYRIARILPDGTATVVKRGGFYDEIFEGQPVVVILPDGRQVPAIVRPRDGYWNPDQATEDFTVTDVRLEFGTQSAKETRALGVVPGAGVTFVKRYRPLLGMRANGRSFDDRVGCAALLLALREIRPEHTRKRVTFLWSVQEEIGLRGARAFAQRHRADVVVPVDTFVSADSPVEPYPYGRARLSAGAVLRAIDSSNIAPPWMVAFLQRASLQRQQPLQWGITRGGNDGAAFIPFGAVDFPIGWPLRYSHSQAEVIDLRDLESLAAWVRFLVEADIPSAP